MTEIATSKRSGKTELLRNRNFMLLWCAYGVSAMGDHLSEMAILKTQNALDAGVDITPLTARMAFVLFVPFFLLSPLAGLLADRLPRRGLMITADLIRCLIMFAFASLIAWTQDWSSWGPFLPLLPIGVFAALFSPARAAMLPTLIRPNQLVRANGMIAGLGIIATMVAMGLGGYLATNYHETVAFRLDALTYLASAMFLLFLRPPRMPTVAASTKSPGSTIRALASGFRYVRTHRPVLQLLAIAAVFWFCGAVVNTVIPAVVRDVYERGYKTMGEFRAFLGLGFIIGATILTMLGEALPSVLAIGWGLVGVSCGVAIFAASVFLPLAPGTLLVVGAVGVILSGMFGVSVMASVATLLQRLVPNRYRGRVFGVRDLVTTGALLIATGMLGIPEWPQVDRWVGFLLAGVSLITLVAGSAVLATRVRRAPFDVPYLIASSTSRFVSRSWYRFERLGPVTLPRQGAMIITSNHTCPADPQLLSAGAPYRKLSFMVAAEYTTWPFLGYIMRVAGCIPVRRGANDSGATKEAIRRLRAGEALGIFIEGRIVPPGEPSEPKDGVALLALRTGAVVIPAYISGVVRGSNVLRGLMSRHRARVRYGKPVDLSEFSQGKPNREIMRAATLKIVAAIQALAPDADDSPPPPSVDSRQSSTKETPYESS